MAKRPTLREQVELLSSDVCFLRAKIAELEVAIAKIETTPRYDLGLQALNAQSQQQMGMANMGMANSYANGGMFGLNALFGR